MGPGADVAAGPYDCRAGPGSSGTARPSNGFECCSRSALGRPHRAGGRKASTAGTAWCVKAVPCTQRGRGRSGKALRDPWTGGERLVGGQTLRHLSFGCSVRALVPAGQCTRRARGPERRSPFELRAMDQTMSGERWCGMPWPFECGSYALTLVIDLSREASTGQPRTSACTDPPVPRRAELQGTTKQRAPVHAICDARRAARGTERAGPPHEPRGRVGGAVWLYLASALLECQVCIVRGSAERQVYVACCAFGTTVDSGDDGPVATRGERAAHHVLGRGDCARRRAVCRRR